MTTLDIMYMELFGAILFSIWALIGFIVSTAETKRKRKKRRELYRKYQKKLKRDQLERFADDFFSVI